MNGLNVIDVSVQNRPAVAPDPEQRPAVDAAVHIVRLADGRLQIRTPRERFTIGVQASLAVDLLRLCDGTRPVDAIVTAMAAQGHSEQHTRSLCTYLTRRAVLNTAPPEDFEDLLLAHARYLAQPMGGGTSSTPVALADRLVQVAGDGHLAEAVCAELALLGIPCVGGFDPRRTDIALIVACSDYQNHDAFRNFNRAAVTMGRPMLFACVAETRIRVGPLVVPGDTACFDCFYHRLRANLSFRDEFDSFVVHNAVLEELGIDSHAGIYGRTLAGFVCAQIVNFLLDAFQHCVADRFVEWGLIDLETTQGRILRLPRCETCGAARHAPAPAARDWL